MKKNNKFLDFVRNFHIIPKLVCVILAFIFWIYVMEIDSPDNEYTFEDISVTVMGTSQLENDRSLSVFSGYDALIDVTVKGQKTIISKYSAEDISVTVDVSEITKSGMYSLELFFDLPSGLTFVDSSATEINMFIDKRTSETVTIEPVLKSYKISSAEYTLGEVVCDADTITVTGPESVLADIDRAIVEINMGDEYLTESITTAGNVILKDQNGRSIESKYLKLSKSTAQVKVPVYGYKDIALTVGGKYGYYNDNIADVSVTPEFVRVCGEPSVLQLYDYIEVTTLDEKKIAESTDLIVDVTLPDNIYAVDGQLGDVTVSIDLKGLVKRTFVVDNIKVINAGNKDVEVIDESVAVTVIGERVAVNKLKAEDISLIVDFTDFVESSGIVYASCNVQFNSDGVDGVLYELGSYNVQVRAK